MLQSIGVTYHGVFFYGVNVRYREEQQSNLFNRIFFLDKKIAQAHQVYDEILLEF